MTGEGPAGCPSLPEADPLTLSDPGVGRELLVAVLDSLEEHVAVLDAAGSIIAVNEPWREFARQNGVSRLAGTVEAVSYLEVTRRAAEAGVPFAAEVLRALQEVLSGERKAWRGEYRCDSPDQARWFVIKILGMASGNGRAVVIHENITPQKVTEAALRESEARSSLAQVAARAGLWQWDLDTGKLAWSDEFYALFGLRPGCDEASFETWRSAVHPEDLEGAEASIADAVASGTLLDNRYRIRLPDGGTKWIRAQGSVLRDDSGKAVRMAGICLDITDSKRAHVHAQSMLRTAMDGIWLVTDTGELVEANEAACAMLGYSRDELIGMHISAIDAAESAEQTRAHVERVNRLGADLFESLHRRKDGSLLPVEISVTVLPEVRQQVAYIRDITQRKRTEAALVAREQHAQVLVRLARHLEVAESYQEAVQAAFEGVHEVLGYRNLWAYLLSDDGTAFRAIAAVGPTAETVLSESGTATLAIDGHPMLEEIAAARDIVVVEDAPLDSKTDKRIVQAMGIRSIVNVPILLMGKSLGSVGMGTFEGEGVRVPDALEREFLMSLGNQFGATFDRLRLQLQRQQAEEALARNEMRLRQAFAVGGLGVWEWDPRTDAVAWFGDMFRIYGVRPEEFTGQGSDYLASTRPDYRETQARNMQLAWSHGVTEEEVGQGAVPPREFKELCIVRPDGTECFTLGEALCILDAQRRPLRMVGVTIDITERKRAEENLRNALAAVEHSSAGIMITDREGSIEYVNPALCQMTGYTAAELVGQNPRILNSGDQLGPFHEQMWARISAGEAWSGRFHNRRKDGSLYWESANISPVFDEAGRITSFISIKEDITGELRQDEERRALERHVARAQKMDSLGSLAGGVAHDMNNVLGAIMALASLHRRHAGPETGLHQAMDTIIKACERGGTLVKGLLGFARQGLGEIRPLDLNALVVEEVALLKHTTLQRVRLEMELDDGLRQVQGDSAALSHALMNLCINAVDAMPEGGALTLRTHDGGGELVEISVTDTGCGMPTEVVEKALDPFFTTKPEGKGTGLGLSIVYGTVKAHRGRMELQSQPGHGTTVRLWLPACEPAANAPQPEAPGAPMKQGLNVLVIDDDDLVQMSLGQLLDALGHSATLVGSGEEGIRLLQEGLAPDALILDWNMPGLGGAGTLPLVRNMRPSLPVLLATGRVDQAARDISLNLPGVTLIQKPFTLEEIEKILDGVAKGGA